jgi:pimeloyl-ACP methyl ester carboxylesterase
MIIRALDRNADGVLDPSEIRSVRIVLFGQSWGGAAAIWTAQQLNRLGVPVLLTVQVDSVGLRDKLIPPNVAAAVNLYQRDRLTIQGRREIRAEDPARTRILGNFEASYRFRHVESDDPSWTRRTLGGSHAKMELDPETWMRVEQFINQAIAKK